MTNAELEDVEIVIAPDHKAFIHTNPLEGLAHGGTFMLQTSLSLRRSGASAERMLERRSGEGDPLLHHRRLHGGSQARPDPDLETRMMGIAFIGAVAAHVDRAARRGPREEILERVRHHREEVRPQGRERR